MSEIEDQIQLGLRLLAEEVQLPTKTRSTPRLRRLAVAVVALAALIVAVALGLVDRSATHAAPRFVRDTFDYRPGGVATGRGFPLLPYYVNGPSKIAAASANDVWFVGSRRSWHWDGTSWRVVSMPAMRGDVYLNSAAAAFDGEVWAVGSRNGPSMLRAGYAFVEHWDGSRWRVLRLPRTGVSTTLLSVSASAPDDVWAVGETYGRDARGRFPDRLRRPLVLHWNGSSWNAVPVPWPRPRDGARIVATGPNDVWVAAIVAEQIEHWDGQSWKEAPAPFGPRDPLWGFSATSADDAWAVGSYLHGRHSRTLAAHWDGQSWQIAPTPNRGTDSDLVDVVSLGSDNAWAIGRTGFDYGGLLFEHWDGESWKLVPGATSNLWDGLPLLAATEDGAAWVLGNCFYDNVVLRWNGSAWTIVRHPPDQHWDRRVPLRDRRVGFGHCRVVRS